MQGPGGSGVGNGVLEGSGMLRLGQRKGSLGSQAEGNGDRCCACTQKEKKRKTAMTAKARERSMMEVVGWDR
jgi:hypothetical protein